MSRFLPVAVASLLLAFPLRSQTNSPQEPGQPVIRTTTREVVLDLVVRDKHQHALHDLRPEEVEVYEDGVRQNIRVFHNVQGAEQLETERSVVAGQRAPAKEPATKKGEGPNPLNTLRQLNFVSVVFADIAP